VRTAKANMAQWLMRMICAMALLFVGFAHQAPVFADGAFVPSEFAEYVLPDGTLPVICIDGKVEGKHRHEQAHAVQCEACRISSAALLPNPVCGARERFRIEANAAWPIKVVVVHGQLFPRSRGARAPPGTLALA
jgi:hypothetical protein